MNVLVAYWHNGLGEEMSSRVRTSFTDEEGETRLAVYSWRERDFILIKQSDCIAVRHEGVIA